LIFDFRLKHDVWIVKEHCFIIRKKDGGVNMKLVIFIVLDEDAFKIMDLLAESNIRVTKLASTGGFLRTGSTTLMSAVSEDDVPKLMDIIEDNSKSRKQFTSLNHGYPGNDVSVGIAHPIEVTRKGAVIFVLDLEDYKTI